MGGSQRNVTTATVLVLIIFVVSTDVSFTSVDGEEAFR